MAERCVAGCPHRVEEQWPKNKVAHRCFAEGRWKGRVVGIHDSRYPYMDDLRPAWCPTKKGA